MASCNILDSYQNEVLNKFSEHYLVELDSLNVGNRKKILTQYKKIISLLCSETVSLEKSSTSFSKLFTLMLDTNIPYVVAINEVNYLKNILLELLIEKESFEAILCVIKLFNKVQNIGAKIYLDAYIKNILTLNNIRITSMSEILKRNVIVHYKEHLVWLSNLAVSIQNCDKTGFPQRNSHICNFGKWLEQDAKDIIHNNSRYKTLIELHNSLHFFADKIFRQFEGNDYHAFLSYLEKCELISLNIGTELALVDNMIMNKMVIKDGLTAALNRNALRQIFENQYEIAFATHNSIILAMCDLDYFKKINDTYGHVAGDKLLIEFVKIVKNKIRNSDIVIRYGGEEFVIILPAITKARGLEILNSIRNIFASSKIVFEGKDIATTVSIGMIEINPDEYYNKNKLEEYIALVDKKLYIAKNNGRNAVYL